MPSPPATLPMMVSDEAALTYGGGSHAQPSRHPSDDGAGQQQLGGEYR